MKAIPASHYVMPEPAAVHRLVSADGTALHSEVHGPKDGDTVVLVHGWTCSAPFWAPVVHRLLDRRLRVVVYDLRGHGRSAIPGRTGYSTKALADDLEAVLRACVPEGSRAVLAGHSMGGMAIMAASGRAAVRDRTAAALLASTGCGDLTDSLQVVRVGSPRIRRAAHRFLATSPLPLGPANAVTSKILAAALMGPGVGKEQARFSARIITACKGRPRSRWGRVLGELDLKTEVAGLTAPTAVLVGTADRLTPLACSEVITAKLPRLVEYTELPGIGHMTPVECPEEVAGAIGRLVENHLRGPGAPPQTAEGPAAEPLTGTAPVGRVQPGAGPLPVKEDHEQAT